MIWCLMDDEKAVVDAGYALISLGHGWAWFTNEGRTWRSLWYWLLCIIIIMIMLLYDHPTDEAELVL